MAFISDYRLDQSVLIANAGLFQFELGTSRKFHFFYSRQDIQNKQDIVRQAHYDNIMLP